jgi:hypothetical protein
MPADIHVECASPLVPRLAALAQAPFGYRCHASAGTSWTAAFIPETNQILTNPFATRRAVRAALPEEFSHAMTIAFKPAQVFPLINYLNNRGGLPGTDCFREFVEAIYIALWPMITGRETLAASLPRSSAPERALAIRILRIARRIAKVANEALSAKQAQHEALWAVALALAFVVPTTPGQCGMVLDLLDIAPVSGNWRGSTEPFKDLFAAMRICLDLDRQHSIPFRLQAFNEPHADVMVMLDIVNRTLQLSPEEIQPIFPTILTVATLQIGGFVPLIWMREHGDTIHAAIEVRDQSEAYVRTHRAVLNKRSNTQIRTPSPIDQCPTTQFYRESVELILECVRRNPPRSRATKAFEVALQTLPKRINQHLRGLWKSRASSCPLCRQLIQREVISDAAEGIARFASAKRKRVIAELNRHEQWLISDGLAMVSAKFRQHFGWQHPIRTEPTHVRDAPLAWSGR